MGFQSVPSVAEVRVHYEINNFPMMNTYHAELTGGYDTVDLEVLAARIDALAVPPLLALQSLHCNYVRTDVLGLEDENDIKVTDNTNTGAGGIFNFAIPRNNAFVVTRRSGLTGRSARGRVFVCGLPDNTLQQSEVGNSQIFSSKADEFLDEVDNFRIVIDASGSWEAVIVSRWNNKIKRNFGITFNWTNSTYQSLKVGSRRERL